MSTMTVDTAIANARNYADIQAKNLEAARSKEAAQRTAALERKGRMLALQAAHDLRDTTGRLDLTRITTDLEAGKEGSYVDDYDRVHHTVREIVFVAPEGTQYVARVHDRLDEFDTERWIGVPVVRIGTCCGKTIDMPLYETGDSHARAIAAAHAFTTTGEFPAEVHTCTTVVVEEAPAPEPKRSWVSRLLGR